MAGKGVWSRSLACKILERTLIFRGSGQSLGEDGTCTRSVIALKRFIISFVVYTCRIRGCGLGCQFLPLCVKECNKGESSIYSKNGTFN